MKIAVLGCGTRGLSAVKAVLQKFPCVELVVVDVDRARLARCISFCAGDVRGVTSIDALPSHVLGVAIDTFELSEDLVQHLDPSTVVSSREVIEVRLRGVNIVGFVTGIAKRMLSVLSARKVIATIPLVDATVVDALLGSGRVSMIDVGCDSAVLRLDTDMRELLIEVRDEKVEVLNALVTLIRRDIVTTENGLNMLSSYIEENLGLNTPVDVRIRGFLASDKIAEFHVMCTYEQFYSSLYATALESSGAEAEFENFVSSDAGFVKLLNNLLTFGCAPSIEVMSTPQADTK